MDLLLYLIDREQVDVYDIPIALITEQFIKHIEVMQTISLDTAGEFIAMAATLMVPTGAYFIYAFLNLVNPLISILYGSMGWSMAPLDDDAPKADAEAPSR